MTKVKILYWTCLLGGLFFLFKVDSEKDLLKLIAFGILILVLEKIYKAELKHTKNFD